MKGRVGILKAVNNSLLDEWPRRGFLLEEVQEERHLRDTPFLKGFKKILAVARFFLNRFRRTVLEENLSHLFLKGYFCSRRTFLKEEPSS